ncbi:MAG TPA: hypothetical protein VL335_00145 [Candidatus Paceibacterota bacterium]|jgi:hypothetical protein|nr:hypothetical protein [Candidatus Paceibacterota bacterium]
MFLHTLHEDLVAKNPVYSSWHKQSVHHVAHWGLFLAISVVIFTGLLNEINASLAETNTAYLAQSVAALRMNRSMTPVTVEPNQQQILFIFKKGVSQATQAQVLKRQDIALVKGTNALGVMVGKISSSDTPEEAVRRLSDMESAYISAAMVDYIGVKSR